MHGDDDGIGLWDQAADQYAQHVGFGTDDSFYRRLSPFMWRHLGDIAGRRVLDVGCGHGWLTEQLRLAGADAAGVDGSSALVRHARSAYPAGTYTVHDLTAGLPRPIQAYHGIVAHMVLMDLPELGPLLADIRAALTNNGVSSSRSCTPASSPRRPSKIPPPENAIERSPDT